MIARVSGEKNSQTEINNFRNFKKFFFEFNSTFQNFRRPSELQRLSVCVPLHKKEHHIKQIYLPMYLLAMDACTDQQAISQDCPTEDVLINQQEIPQDWLKDQQEISKEWPAEESFIKKEILKWRNISDEVYKIKKVKHRESKYGLSAILTLKTKCGCRELWTYR